MKHVPRARRFIIALTSIGIAAMLLHRELSSALVTRGDDLMRAGETSAAVGSYARAIALDKRSAIAADRLAFVLLERREPGDAARSYAVADRALHAASDDPALLIDRALAASRLRRWRDAERDFTAAAHRAKDPRYLHLAARIAERRGDRNGARTHLYAALALDPAYAPARAALRRSVR